MVYALALPLESALRLDAVGPHAGSATLLAALQFHDVVARHRVSLGALAVAGDLGRRRQTSRRVDLECHDFKTAKVHAWKRHSSFHL
jgi:hypothetical protein